MDFTNILRKIKSYDKFKESKIVAIQLPEGLKRRTGEIAKELGDKEVVFIGDPFWGACDIPSEGSWDLLIQFGHSPIPNIGPFKNVIFEELQEEMEKDLDCNKVPFETLTLTSNVTYSNQLPKIKGKLEDSGKKVTLKRGDSRVFYPGQILGCNVSSARTGDKNILFIGEGLFHPLGIALAFPEKTVLAFNPRTGEYVDMEKERRKFLAQRYGAIERASNAMKFGIIVSTMVGQTRYSLAKATQKLIREEGRESFILTLDLVRDEELLNFPADVYVNTACPRVTIEDYGTFSRPVVTIYELQMALGKRDKSRYIFDEIVMVDEISGDGIRQRIKSPGHN